MHWVLNVKVHQTCTGTKKYQSVELQSAPNLHRDKKNKNKNFTIYVGRGDYPSKVFVFFVPVQVWCTLKFKTFVFFVPVQVWCTLKFKTCAFFVPVQVLCILQLKPSVWRFGMTHGLLSKCIILQGIGIVCLNVMFFHCFCWFPDSGFFQNNII